MIGGSLIITGTINKQVVVGNNSWWSIGYDNLIIDFDTSTPTANMLCWTTILAPAGCAAAIASEPGSFAPIAGNEGAAGAARESATFDGTTLSVFTEGFDGATGTDYLNVFTLTVGGGDARPISPALDVTESSEAGEGAIALLGLSNTTGPSGQVNPQVLLFDEATGAEIRAIEFFTESNQVWQPIAIDTIHDANSDGVAADPAIVMLAENLETGQIKVHFRGSESGAKLRANVPFFTPNWKAMDVAVVEDINGDGTTGDAGIAVLARSDVDGRVEVRMTPYDTVNNLPTFQQRFFSHFWDVKAIEASIEPGGGDSVIVALGTDAGGKSKAQVRRVSDGSLRISIYGWGAEVDSTDIAISNNMVVFYGNRIGSETSTVSQRGLNGGEHGPAYTFLGSDYFTGRITGTSPLGSLAASGTDRGDFSLIIKVRDQFTGDSEGNIKP